MNLRTKQKNYKKNWACTNKKRENIKIKSQEKLNSRSK